MKVTEENHYSSGHPSAEMIDCPWCNDEQDRRTRYILFNLVDSVVMFERYRMEPTAIRDHASRYLYDEAIERLRYHSYTGSSWNMVRY